MNKKYIVRLTDDERAQLSELVNKGTAQAYRIKHANILLRIDASGAGWGDEQAARAFGCHVNTVRNVRQRLVEEGLAAALERKKQETPSRERILDGECEARLIALACTEAPAGRAKWTMRLLAEALVELDVVEEVSRETVRRTLKKMNCSLIGASAG